MKKKLIIILTVILFVILVFFFAFDSRLKVVEYIIESEKVSDEIKLALITDLHNCLYGENQSQLLGEMEKAEPDAVLLGGDIFDNVYVNDNGKVLIKSLSKAYKTYYVSGNHEWWGNEMYEIFEFLENAGVTVLRGDTEIMESDGKCAVKISGIDDPDVNEYDSAYTSFDKQLENVANNAEEKHFDILLTHRPEFGERYFDSHFDLVLAGHAHGGQFRLPFIMNGFFAPNQGFLPKFAGGCYDFKRGKMIVSRGLSRENFSLPRIFNRPELVFVTVTNQ